MGNTMSYAEFLRNEISKKYNHEFWFELIDKSEITIIDKYFMEVINTYAEKCARATLNSLIINSSKNVIKQDSKYWINLDSVKDENNITLL